MVWAETREVGCGVVYYDTTKDGIWHPKSKTYVCNYGPAGNVLTRPMYTIGPHATKCPNGVYDDFKGLCDWEDVYNDSKNWENNGRPNNEKNKTMTLGIKGLLWANV